MGVNRIQPLLLVAAALVLLVNCGGDTEPLLDTEATVPAEIQEVPTVVPTAIPTSNPATNVLPTPTIAHATPAAPTAATVTSTTATTSGLTATCSFDKEAPKITCHASGAPEGSESKLKWESNISGWDSGPAYEIALKEEYQLVPEVVVSLELCQGTNMTVCERIETAIDTSVLVSATTADRSVIATPTPKPDPSSEAASLAALCSLDQEAAKITCRANGAPEGFESQLKWESNISGWTTGPTYEISITEWVNAVTVTLELCQGSDCKKAEAYVDTSRVAPGSNGNRSGDNKSTPDANKDATSGDLAAVCSLDEEAEKITCYASGAPEGSESQLKWDSGISGWAMGPTYEISITERVHSVIVTLELCQGSDCKKAEAYVDTSWVTPVSSGSGSGDNKSTPDASNESAAKTPVAIESLTCDDSQITIRYTTTCRAKLSGDVDWVMWQFKKGQVSWNRDTDPEATLADVLVVSEITRDDAVDYVIPFKACTGGGDWYPGAKCVEKSITIKVVAGAPHSVGNGLPCESNTNPSFERWIIDNGQTEKIWATGSATHSGTAQHSYIYPSYELEPNGIPVYAPVDGYLWEAETKLIYSNGVKDYTLSLMVSCEVWIKFGHVVNPIQKIVDLVDSVADETGHGKWNAKPPLKYVNEQIDPIFFKAGDVLFHHLPNRPGTNQGFDYGLMNDTYINQYLNPARWENTTTFLNAQCPSEYQAEPTKSQIINLIVPYQSTGATCPGVTREVSGTLSGMWHFADPTAPVLEGHTLRFGGDLVFVEYFENLIHVAGVNSKDIGGVGGQESLEEFILRLGPGDATYALPQEVTTSHCYEGSNLKADVHPNNFDYMFLYVEIVDDMTINVAFNNGTCPSSLPADYITYLR